MNQPDTTAPKKKSDLIPRLATAVVAVPILFAIAFMGPNALVWALFAAAAGIGVHEFYTMTLNRDLGAGGWAGILGTVGTLAALYWCDDGMAVFASMFATVIAILFLTTFGSESMEVGGKRALALLSGYAYVGVLFAGMVLLVADEPGTVGDHQAGWFLLPMATIWAGDTGAYFAGRAFGRHKLAPKISPKKTWEGAIGGLVASVIGALIIRFTLLEQLEVWHVFAMAVPASVFGQAGDLVESMFKRATGFKDSGTIIYGHGGMLDRVDALIVAAPLFAIGKHLIGA